MARNIEKFNLEDRCSHCEFCGSKKGKALNFDIQGEETKVCLKCIREASKDGISRHSNLCGRKGW